MNYYHSILHNTCKYMNLCLDQHRLGFKVQGLFIRHILNDTGYNQKWKVKFECVCGFVFELEGDTGVNSQTSPVSLPQKCISSRPNPMKNLGENPVPSTPIDSHSLPLPCCFFLCFFADNCQLQ